MAIAIGNKTQANPNPNGNSYTISHNQNTGTDLLLFVSITMANTTNYGTITYNGVSLTQLRNSNRTGLAQRMWTGYLLAPATGANDLVINFTGGQFSPISIYICSFTGAGGIGNQTIAGGSITPHDESLTVSSNSVVYVTACSTVTITDIEIPLGDSRPAEFTHNTNRQVEGSLSTLSAFAVGGTYTMRTECNTGSNVTNDSFEIQEAGGGGGFNPTLPDDGDFFMCL